ncbi:MAG: hypothetical protein HZC41_01950 [Chloroflexi bacterium]|nr:hypothetical protein [Chloroflexota bacterium]
MNGWVIVLLGIVFIGAVAIFLDPGVGFFMAAVLLPLLIIEYVIQSNYVRVLRTLVDRYRAWLLRRSA